MSDKDMFIKQLKKQSQLENTPTRKAAIDNAIKVLEGNTNARN